MSKPDPPKPANPHDTANAQTGMNIRTAVANSYLNNTNQYGPDGSVEYSVNGWKDVNGRKIPRWSQTTTLSEMARRLYDVNNQTKYNLGIAARDQAERLGGLLSRPVNLSNEATEGRLFDLGRQRLDPMFADRMKSTATSLATRGIREGTAAYDRAMNREGESRNDAYNQLALTGRGQAVQEALTERNQPLNEISAILSGNQVGMPQFGPTNSYGIANTDYAGIRGNYDNAMLNRYQMQMQQKQGMYGGLFGMLGSGFAAFSDERLKENIVPIGKTNDNLTIATYNYKGTTKPEIGLIAQEVAEKKPEAVQRHPSGFLIIDYGKALSMKQAA